MGRGGQGYAIWDLTAGGPAIRTFPSTPEGWVEAWEAYQGLETPSVAPSAWTRDTPIVPRPMAIGQILDAAINLYRLHFRTVIPLVAFVVVPFNFLVLWILRLQIPEDIFGITLETAREITFRITVLGWVASALEFLLIAPFLTAAVVHVAGEAYLGRPTSVRVAYREAVRRIHSILWVTVLTMLIVMLIVAPAILIGVAAGDPSAIFVLLLLTAVPAIMVFISLIFGSQVVVLESHRGTKALRRSRFLTRGLRWKIFASVFLAGVLAAILEALLTLPFQLIGEGSLEGPGWVLLAVGASVAEMITTPFVILVTVLLYFDARVRKEGFDLEVMAQQLGESEPPAVP